MRQKVQGTGSSLTCCTHSSRRRTHSELWQNAADVSQQQTCLSQENVGLIFLQLIAGQDELNRLQLFPSILKVKHILGRPSFENYTKSLKSNLIMPYSYSGIFTKRNNNFMLLKASNEAPYAGGSLICTHITLSPSDSWTYHTVSLKAAGSLPRLQRAEWKFAADDRSCEMKVHFTSSLLCLHLSRPPERGPNPPPSVYITQWIQPLWKRAGGRTAAILQP